MGRILDAKRDMVTIATLRAELEAVKAENARLEGVVKELSDEIDTSEEEACMIEDDMRKLEASVAQLKAENGRLLELLRAFLTSEYESKTYLCDCIDNDGKPYQSQWLADKIAEAETLCAALTGREG